MVAPDLDSNPWAVDEANFPILGSLSQQLYFALHYAVLAPSSHNSQPWLFKIREDSVLLYADRTRALPVVDPEDRELIISCGAALYNLRLALRYFGFTADVELSPDPEDPDLLARVRPGAPHVTTAEEQQLFQAIPQRSTNRQPFENQPVPDEVVAVLRDVAQEEGAIFVPIQDERDRTSLIQLIVEGDHEQWADGKFRRELACWLHSNRTRSHDGMPGYAHGVGDFASLFGSRIVRTFDRGDGTAARDAELAMGSPLLAVLGTAEDTPSAWLSAGQALERVLLRAQADGIAASYLNQPVEIPTLRTRLREAITQVSYPQMVIRMGYGPAAQATPRRTVDEVLLLI